MRFWGLYRIELPAVESREVESQMVKIGAIIVKV